MQVKNLQTQKGFTLVEIAIVLVIIGLLLGGVLKGQELINNSKIKAVTQDFEGTTAAYYAYRDRIGNVPGDVDSDGTIDSDDGFWFNLRTEGFIKGALGTSTASPGPVHALDGSFTAHDGGAAGTVLFTKNFICADNVANKDAASIDTKIDDGNALTGVIRSAAGNAEPTAGVAYVAGSDAATWICKEL